MWFVWRRWAACVRIQNGAPIAANPSNEYRFLPEYGCFVLGTGLIFRLCGVIVWCGYKWFLYWDDCVHQIDPVCMVVLQWGWLCHCGWMCCPWVQIGKGSGWQRSGQTACSFLSTLRKPENISLPDICCMLLRDAVGDEFAELRYWKYREIFVTSEEMWTGLGGLLWWYWLDYGFRNNRTFLSNC